MEKKDLRSLTIEEMTELAESMGQKTFRGKQLFEWIHKKQVENLEEISNLPKAFLEPLQAVSYTHLGAGVALVTPMNQDGSVNYDKLKEVIEQQIAGHTDAIIICGTTGEASTLTVEEHIECIRYCCEVVNKRCV